MSSFFRRCIYNALNLAKNAQSSGVFSALRVSPLEIIESKLKPQDWSLSRIRKPKYLESGLGSRWKYITTIFGITAPIVFYYATESKILFPPQEEDVRINTLSSVLPLNLIKNITPLNNQELHEQLTADEWDVFMEDRGETPRTSLIKSIGYLFSPARSPYVLPVTPIISIHVNQVKSNAIIEDTYAIARTQKGVILGVFDGHSGTECSLTLKEFLTHYLTAEIDNIPEGLTSQQRKVAIYTALKNGFIKMDNDIIKGGFLVRSGSSRASVYNKDNLGDCLAPALSGSCALVAYVEGDDAYFANTGDSRAIIGSKYGESMFRHTAVTTDHTFENSREYTRVLSEHQGEHSNVVCYNRLFGYLQPSRAFGDAKFKYPPSTAKSLVANRMAKIPFINKYVTPPYLTAEPEISHYKINKMEDKFIAIYTDGIHDKLTNDDVVFILGNYYRTYIGSLFSKDTASESTLDLPSRKRLWNTSNHNAATRLIRNSIGMGVPTAENYIMTIAAPYSRSIKDDMTVIVAFIGTEDEMEKLKHASKIIKEDSPDNNEILCVSKIPCKSISDTFTVFKRSYVHQKSSFIEAGVPPN